MIKQESPRSASVLWIDQLVAPLSESNAIISSSLYLSVRIIAQRRLLSATML